MPDVRVVVVAPKFEGNIGAIARSMANFDVSELYLVHPCEIGDDAWRRAKHGADILKNAHIVETFEEALEGCFLVAGTSGVATKGDKNYVRIPISAHDFAERVKDYPEKIAVVFGREDIGLLQDELARCDIFVNIPSSDTYPILNLSHAAAIVLYELFGTEMRVAPKPADTHEKELMFEYFDGLLDSIGYPVYRRESTSNMFRRMMGRAVPTKWEYNTIMGVFGDAKKIIDKDKKQE
jgi:tRNA/rRNA methyltransferase